MEGMCRSTGGCSQNWRESVIFSTRTLGTSESVVASNSDLFLSLVNHNLNFLILYFWEYFVCFSFLIFGGLNFFVIFGILLVGGINKSGTESEDSTLQSSPKDPL